MLSDISFTWIYPKESILFLLFSPAVKIDARAKSPCPQQEFIVLTPFDFKLNNSSSRHKSQQNPYRVFHAVINGLFKSAVLDDTIDKNPMDKVPRPKQSKDEEVSDEPLSYTAEEARYIMSCLENEPLRWKVYVLLLIDTGCRRGEISGLRWKEIDFDSSTITIDRNLQYSPAKGTYVTTPKGRKKRIVDLSHKVVELLLQLKEEQDPKSEWVFTQKRSTLPIHPDTPNKFSKRFEKKYGIEHFHPHKLRHTSASIAITNGADVVSVAARLGHADSSTTLRMYAHANSESIRKAGQVVRDAILTKDTDEKSPWAKLPYTVQILHSGRHKNQGRR